MAVSTSFGWLVLLPTIAYALSVCDEVDITFLATPDSIIGSLDTIKMIMQRIMTDGSSDHTDYNLMLYGDAVPVSFENTINPLFNPTVLEDIRLDLQHDTGSTSGASSIRVSDAIRQYKSQSRSPHNKVSKPYLKRLRFKQFCDHNYTATQYIVFADDISEVQCDAKGDEINVILKNNTTGNAVGNECKMNVFTQYNLIHNAKEIMRFHSITCSAKVLDNDGNEMLLNHRAQFVDADSFLKCNFVFDTAHGDRLDSNKSYIYVMDGTEEYTTYKLNDYLIVTRDELEHLPDSCKGALVYKVTDIHTVSVRNLDLEGLDANRTMRLNVNQTTIIRLSIASPRTFHEYIFKANFEKDQRIKPKDQEHHRRMFVHVGLDKEILDYSWENSDRYTGQGSDISYSVSLDVSINVYFKMDWDLWSGNEEFEFYIYGEYSAEFNFDVTVTKQQSIPFADVINVVQDSVPSWIGVIPVWTKPYLKTNAKLTVSSPVV